MNRRTFLLTAPTLLAPAAALASTPVARKRDTRTTLERLIDAEWRDRPWDTLHDMEKLAYKTGGDDAWWDLAVKACRRMEARAKARDWDFVTYVVYTAMKGKTRSAEARANMAACRVGKPLSEAHRASLIPSWADPATRARRIQAMTEGRKRARDTKNA